MSNTTCSFLRRLIPLSVLTVTSALLAAEAALGLPTGAPAALGFAPGGLAKTEKFLRAEIDAKRYAGAVWLIARDGMIAAHGATGLRDVEAKLPMTEDTIFRIFSMTKPVTVVAALSLIEEGQLNLDDPVSRYLPALAQPQVLVGGTADAPQFAAAERPITIRHLLTHTSGYGYDIFAVEPLKTFWTRAKVWEAAAMDDFIANVAKVPLAHQPGTRWTYGINLDILAAVIEKITGQTAGAVMSARIFTPLGMKDTGFSVPTVAIPRIAKTYRRTATDGFGTAMPMRRLIDANGSLRTRSFDEGGGGLFSTLRDYTRFAQMLLNGGELDGVRVLSRKSVELMAANHVTHLPATNDPWTPPGFGFGVSVRVEGAFGANSLGSPGQFGWQGYATTYFTVDPRERMIALLLVQHQPYNEDGVFERFANTVYGALAK